MMAGGCWNVTVAVANENLLLMHFKTGVCRVPELPLDTEPREAVVAVSPENDDEA
jgi:hypothetical protein